LALFLRFLSQPLLRCPHIYIVSIRYRIMVEYDLTQNICVYLDRHLVFPLLEFLGLKGVYSEQELLKAKLDLLDKTNMVDFAMDIYTKLYGTEDVPQAMKDRREEVVSNLRNLQNFFSP